EGMLSSAKVRIIDRWNLQYVPTGMHRQHRQGRPRRLATWFRWDPRQPGCAKCSMEARIQVGLERAQSRALPAFGRAASPNQAKTGTDSDAIYQAPEADPSGANRAR